MNLSVLKEMIKNVSSEILDFISGQKLYQVHTWYDSSSFIGDSRDLVTDDPTKADVVSSLIVRPKIGNWEPTTFMYHKPVLDIDFPVYVVESSTPGHYHLFLDRELESAKYFKLLDALAEAGVLESGYVNAAKRRGSTMVRLPWVKK